MTYLFTVKEIGNSFTTGKKVEGLARILIGIIAPFGGLIILWEQIRSFIKKEV